VIVDVPDEREGAGRYEAAAAALETMQRDGTLVTDDAPSFYVYRMSYTDETGRARSTTGVLGALELSRPGEGGILPHEHTTPKAKSDRLDLLRATHHNLSPIWGLSVAEGLAAACQPTGEPDGSCIDDDGVRHELWRLTDPDRVEHLSVLVASGPVVVADGHHRYETSLAYRDERRVVDGEGGAWDSTLAYIVELTDAELGVRAIHRLLRGGGDLIAALGTWFDVESTTDDETLLDRMVDEAALALVTPGDSYLLRPRPGAFPAELPDLDSARLSHALAGLADTSVEYQHGADIVRRRVAAGEADAGVLLRPATVAQIAATAHGGERMPPKTTFFWPKPRTGFVFRSLA
jgi:uncharacterized protein (DUF1015 family)